MGAGLAQLVSCCFVYLLSGKSYQKPYKVLVHRGIDTFRFASRSASTSLPWIMLGYLRHCDLLIRSLAACFCLMSCFWPPQ